MSFSEKQIKSLEKIIASATELLKSANTSGKTSGKAPASRKRRAGKELAAFRKMLAAERSNGIAVAKLAKTHGVSAAYIYQLPVAKKASSKKAAKKTSPTKAPSKSAARKVVAKKARRKASGGRAKLASAPEAVVADTQA